LFELHLLNKQNHSTDKRDKFGQYRAYFGCIEAFKHIKIRIANFPRVLNYLVLPKIFYLNYFIHTNQITRFVGDPQNNSIYFSVF
jgi:hypothetical protein